MICVFSSSSLSLPTHPPTHPDTHSEFQMAEIEHFVNPNDKLHPRFADVADVELNLFSRDLQGGAEENTVCVSVGHPGMVTGRIIM